MLLQSPRCTVSCCAVHCLVLLMAACRQCCIAGPVGPRCSLCTRWSRCWTVPFVTLLFSFVRLGLTVHPLVVLLSRLSCSVDCPILRVLVVDASFWQTVRVLLPPSWLLCRITPDTSAGSLLGCSRFVCTCIICFVIDWGCPLALAVLDLPTFVVGLFTLYSGVSAPALCRAHSFPVSDRIEGVPPCRYFLVLFTASCTAIGSS